MVLFATTLEKRNSLGFGIKSKLSLHINIFQPWDISTIGSFVYSLRTVKTYRFKLNTFKTIVEKEMVVFQKFSFMCFVFFRPDLV